MPHEENIRNCGVVTPPVCPNPQAWTSNRSGCHRLSSRPYWIRYTSLMLSRRGAVAKSGAVALAQPLTFREWRPDERQERGLSNIPYPSDGRVLVPNVVIAPVAGFDPQCYRLGFGGGCYDRTLAILKANPRTIAAGYTEAAIRTIFPQPYDIPMNWIVTGTETVHALYPGNCVVMRLGERRARCGRVSGLGHGIKVVAQRKCTTSLIYPRMALSAGITASLHFTASARRR